MKGVFVGQTPDQIKKLKDNPKYAKYVDLADFPYKTIHVQPKSSEEPEQKKKNKTSKTH